MTYIAFSNVQTQLTTIESLALDGKDVDFSCRHTWVSWLSILQFTPDNNFLDCLVRTPTLVAIQPIHDDKKIFNFMSLILSNFKCEPALTVTPFRWSLPLQNKENFGFLIFTVLLWVISCLRFTVSERFYCYWNPFWTRLQNLWVEYADLCLIFPL